MIETTDPEINVVDLMQRIRRMAREARPSEGPDELARQLAQLPPFPSDSPPPPRALQLGRDVIPELKEAAADLLTRARRKTEIETSLPQLLHPLRRNQGGFNGILLELARHLAETNVGLQGQIYELQDHLAAQRAWLEASTRERRSEAAWAEGVQALAGQIVSRLGEQEASSHATRAELSALRELARVQGIELGRLQNGMPSWQARVEDLARQQEQAAGRLEPAEARLSGLEAGFGDAVAHLASLQGLANRQGEHLDRLQEQANGLTRRLADLHARSEGQSERLDRLRGQAEGQGEHLRNLQVETDGLRELAGQLQDQGNGQREHLDQLQADAEHTGAHVRNLQGLSDSLRERVDDLDGRANRQREHLADFQSRVEGLNGHAAQLRGQVDSWHGRLTEFQEESGRAGAHLRNLQGQTDGISGRVEHLQGRLDSTPADELRPVLAELRQTVGRLDERQTADSSYLKAELSLHQRVVRSLLDAARGEGGLSAKPPAGENGHAAEGEPGGALARVGQEQEESALDAFYVAFENEFRGSRETVKERVRVYLPYLKEASAGAEDRPVLDVGCGRGEWLELLRENGFAARGLDLNACMVEQCQARGLEAERGDVIRHLRALPAESLGAVTGFHIIEHLPFPTLLELFSEACRVLKPGGVAIFESPNCKNLVVGACNFYSDPTHRNPVFPDTARFMLANRGFEPVEIKYLMPAEGSPFNASQLEGATLAGWFYGPRDFAVIGRKGAAGQPMASEA